jgi:hypothetical protein
LAPPASTVSLSHLFFVPEFVPVGGNDGVLHLHNGGYSRFQRRGDSLLRVMRFRSAWCEIADLTGDESGGVPRRRLAGLLVLGSR